MGNVVADTTDGTGFPAWTGATWDRVHRCATARTRTRPRPSTGTGAPVSPQAEQLHGKEMSYNNYVDADAAARAAHDHADQRVAIIKHANPCGIAVGADVARRTARRTRATPCRPSAASSPRTGP